MPRQRRHSESPDLHRTREADAPTPHMCAPNDAGDDDGANLNGNMITSLGHAADGFWHAAISEPSVRNHLLGALAMVVCLVIVQPAPIWWGVCLFASALLVALELFNTAIERLADHIAPERHAAIGSVKDIAAGAVVCASIGVLALGVTMILDSVGAFG